MGGHSLCSPSHSFSIVSPFFGGSDHEYWNLSCYGLKCRGLSPACANPGIENTLAVQIHGLHGHEFPEPDIRSCKLACISIIFQLPGILFQLSAASSAC
jgi:hypothetical protein